MTPKAQQKITVYSPASCLRHPGQLMRSMIADLVASRELAWRLFIRNLSAQYRQTMFGYLWAFLPPLFSMAVWVYLNSQKVIDVQDPGMPYPLFVLTGTVLWQIFVDAMNSPLKLVTESKSMLAKINFPREALILAGLGEVLFNFVIRIFLLAGIFVWFQMIPPVTLFYVPLGVLGLLLLGLMFGILMTPLGVLYTDVSRGIVILAQLWFFLTPVVYPMPQSGAAAVLARLNPVTPLLTTTREWMVTGFSTQLSGFWLVVLLAFVFLLLGWLLYRIAMPHLIARISA
ncbi:ABC transporter permease [uncultured Desulfuromonas sp.]|uniref:ABC transporter permease n=1 Tax=uncultured Desulfuromonas sp. TaxID=181013 RepID=UPI002AAB4BE4|nr:ABC transporter permease [uncultured Desulfuromonas sp.]